MNRVYCLKSTETLDLIEELGHGGEGTISRTSKSNYVAKIYYSKSNQEKFEKLKIMLDNPPCYSSQAKEHISIAWPVDILLDQDHKCVGFLMPEIKNSKPLISVYNPTRRGKEAVGFNWLYLHTTALNTALILESLHHYHYTVGDLKTDNLRVNARALVSIVDTDSFQIKDSSTGKVYLSSMGSDEYTPPEMYDKDLSAVERSEVQDLFGLAIIIWLLIFGKHPFSGKWIGSGNDPQINENIKAGYWLYGDNSKIKPADLAIPINVVHPRLQQLFYQCFSVGHNNPYARPTASKWSEALQIAINDLQHCQNNTEHYYSTGYGKCHWCEISNQLKFDMFPANSPTVPGENSTKVPITIPLTQILEKTSNNPIVKVQKNYGSSSTSASSASSSTKQTSHQYQPTAPAIPQRKRSKGLRVLAFIAMCFFLFRPSHDFLRNAFSRQNQSASQRQSTQPNESNSNLGKYPLESCGDSDHTDIDTWYPVFIRSELGNLDKVKIRFCRDAFPNRREELNRVDIQVACFRNKARAEEFAEFMRSQLGSGEVGKPGVVLRKLSPGAK